MVCYECSSVAKKHGKDRYGHQRYRCKACSRTFVQTEAKPLGDMRLELDQAVLALKLLLEGMSIRSTERITNIHRDTLCNLVATVGKNCKTFLRSKVRDVKAVDVECDEIWGFVGCKEKTRQRLGHAENQGDAYCFVAIERTTKLVINWHLGKRSSDDTTEFVEDLRQATTGRFQVSTDGFRPYQSGLPFKN